MKKKKKVWLSLLTLIFMVMVTEVALHAVYLIVNLKKVDQRYLLPPYQNKDWAQDLFQEYWQTEQDFAPFIEWQWKEYQGKYTNIYPGGLRKTWHPEPFRQELPDTLYVFGGSAAWGAGARDDFTIPSFLSKLINNREYHANVYNFGGLGYTFPQGLIRLILLLKDGHKPKYVIFYDGFNDIYAAYQSGRPGAIQNMAEIREKLDDDGFALLKRGLKEILATNCMLYKSLNRISSWFRREAQFQEVGSRYNDEQLAWLAENVADEYGRSQELLARLAKIYGFQYLCFFQPVIFVDRPMKEEELTDVRLADKKLETVCRFFYNQIDKRTITHFYNLSQVLRDRKKPYYIDVCHLSEDGNEVVAAEIYQIIRKGWPQAPR